MRFDLLCYSFLFYRYSGWVLPWMKLLSILFLQRCILLRTYCRYDDIVICMVALLLLSERAVKSRVYFFWQYYIFAYVDAPSYQILKNLNIISTGILYRIILNKKWGQLFYWVISFYIVLTNLSKDPVIRSWLKWTLHESFLCCKSHLCIQFPTPNNYLQLQADTLECPCF